MRPGTVTIHFDSPAEALEFWERTNPPLIALKTMLPADRYRQCRDAAVDLFATGRRKGEVELASPCVYVLAGKAGH